MKPLPELIESYLHTITDAPAAEIVAVAKAIAMIGDGVEAAYRRAEEWAEVDGWRRSTRVPMSEDDVEFARLLLAEIAARVHDRKSLVAVDAEFERTEGRGFSPLVRAGIACVSGLE